MSETSSQGTPGFSVEGLNRVIQASHEVLSLMEESKSEVERLFDDLPDIFTIVTPTGMILKANRTLENRFNARESDLLNRSIFEVFDNAGCDVFRRKMAEAELHPNGGLEFELKLSGPGVVEKAHHWFVKKLFDITADRTAIFLVIGRDISQLKSYQQQLLLQRQIELLFVATREMSLCKEPSSACLTFVKHLMSVVALESGYHARIFFRDDSNSSTPFSYCELAVCGEVLSDTKFQNVTELPSGIEALFATNHSELSYNHDLLIPVTHGDHGQAVILIGPLLERVHDRRTIMSFVDTLASSLAITLESLRFSSEKVKQARLEGELEAVRTVHTALLPATTTANIPGLEMAATFQPASQAGGDWFGFHYDESQHRFYFYIGDVTGHGIPSALITGLCCGAIYGGEGMCEITRKGEPTSALEHLETMARVVNKVICERGKGQYFVTMNFISLDLKTGELFLLNAGHTHPYWIQNTTSNAKLIAASGPRLGFSLTSKFGSNRVILQPGDILFLYTDGLVENEGPGGERLPVRVLKKLLTESMDVTKIKESLMGCVGNIWGRAAIEDDVSTFMIQWKGPINLERAAS